MKASPFIKSGRGVSVQLIRQKLVTYQVNSTKEAEVKEEKSNSPVRTWKDVLVKDINVSTSRKESFTKFPESGSVIESVRSGAV